MEGGIAAMNMQKSSKTTFRESGLLLLRLNLHFSVFHFLVLRKAADTRAQPHTPRQLFPTRLPDYQTTRSPEYQTTGLPDY